MIRAVLFASALLGATVLAAAESPVGFRVIQKRDPTRSIQGAPEGRPIQIAVWYPAKPAKASASTLMRYRDYMTLSLSEKSFAPPTPAAVEQMLGEYRKFLAATGVESADAEALIATPMRAIRDAPAAEGSFP